MRVLFLLHTVKKVRVTTKAYLVRRHLEKTT